MNIAFFLLPKDEVVFLSPRSTMRQTLERMEYHRYSAVPLVNHEGRYVGTITEGDLLWKIKNTPGLSFENTHHVKLEEVEPHKQNQAVNIDADMGDLIDLSLEQNFVPVVDDNGIFIGIVRRKEIIEYCAQLLRKPPLSKAK